MSSIPIQVFHMLCLHSTALFSLVKTGCVFVFFGEYLMKIHEIFIPCFPKLFSIVFIHVFRLCHY